MVLACPLVFADLATEEVVGRLRRTLIIQAEQAEGLAPQKIVAAVFKHLLIGTASSFLQYVHRNKLADVLGRSTEMLICIERAEHLLVNVACDVTEELAVPFQLVIVLFALTLAHESRRCREESQLFVYG